MSGEYTLLSCANDIRIWDLQKQSALVEFSPHKSTVNCARWNHNNQVLVSGGDDGEVVLSHQSGRSLGRLPTDVTKSEPVRALAFSSGSRYLCSGGASQVVDVWDLKKKEKTRSFAGHTAGITSVIFGRGDSKVASASESGTVLIHSVLSGTLNATLQVQSPIRSVDYSPTELHLLSSGDDGGNVDLWDTNAQALVKSWAVHEDVISQVAFSPSSLLCSVGLDKRLLFVDIATQKVAKQVICDYALTCVDFMDGVTLAVGTVGSHILCYDLRKTDAPVSKITDAHAAPVISCIQFQSRSKRAASGEESPEKVSPHVSRLSPSPKGRVLEVSVPPTPEPERVTPPSRPLPPVNVGDGQFLRNCVGEAVKDLRSSVQSDLNNVQFEMIRQFHQQLVDMKTLLQGFSTEQAALVAEVQEMRDMYKQIPGDPIPSRK